MTRGHQCSPQVLQRCFIREMLNAPQHQAYPSVLIVILLGVCSLLGLLGLYASERTIGTHQGSLEETKGGATCRKAQLWKGAEQIPRLLHRLELSGSGVPTYTEAGLITSGIVHNDASSMLHELAPRCMHEPPRNGCHTQQLDPDARKTLASSSSVL